MHQSGPANGTLVGVSWLTLVLSMFHLLRFCQALIHSLRTIEFVMTVFVLPDL